MTKPFPTAQLIDRRNWEEMKPKLIAMIASKDLIGIDIETQDSGRHEGLNRLMAVNEDGFKSATKSLIFDVNRTVITGFSIYGDEEDTAYYINLAHADIENRLDFSEVKCLLEAKKSDAYWIAHNAVYELTMLFKSLGYDLGKNVLCTMQLAVTCWNPDTYDIPDFQAAPLGGITSLFGSIMREFGSWSPGQPLSKEQEELVGKVTAKESKADHSYNGFVKSIAYGFGLKALTKKFLNYTQITFEEVLGGHPHMGCLTGDEVCSYGADDAWVCVWLFKELLAYLVAKNPSGVETYFSQEAPMSRIYSKVWREGVLIDKDVISKAKDRERENIARTLRKMKAAVKALLPYPAEVHEKLSKYDEKGYGKNFQKYRDAVTKWAKSPDSEDTFTQLYQVRGSASKAMAEERKRPESSGVNLTYFQAVRSLLYDLCGCSFQLAQGKIQSDSDAREVMKERLLKKYSDIVKWSPKDQKYVWTEENEKVKATLDLIDGYKELAASEQVTKLYITNYLNMIDPDTGRMYPQLTCMLATRRLALAQPNLSQLAKNSSIAYIRSCFLADSKDHVLISADWSSVELVIIGDESGDPEFRKAFGQLPYEDLHRLAAASVMDLSLEEFDAHPDKKKLRTDLGKGSNFNYWYSGALGTIAGLMGWSSEEMWERVEKYRERFAVAERWRTDTILEGRENGFVQLRDGLRRYRFEATPMWASMMREKFEQHGPVIRNFGDLCIKRIQTRAGNQLVNAKVQGTGATLMKRSLIKWHELYENQGLARFMFPVHDECVFSVHKSHAVEFIQNLRKVMNTHPEIIKTLQLNCSVAIGRNYLAWHKTDNPFGQVEVDELQKGFPLFSEDRYDKRLTDEEIQKVVEYMCG